MDQVCILVIIAALLWSCSTETLNFHQSGPACWDDARKHCQACFKDLVTVRHDNIHQLVNGATDRHWVGFRENLGPGLDPWSGWANGDPITFQNWLPGKRPAEVATTTAAIATVTNASSFVTYDATLQTAFTAMATAVTDVDGKGPAQRESCVAMLPYGPWVEEDCSVRLPYICYDQPFYGTAGVHRTATTAALSWSRAPGTIAHYVVEVRGGMSLNDTVTGLTYDLFNMTPGTQYTVRVFGVKCDRRLNSQNVSFVTEPEEPQNLTAVNVSESSVVLRWEPPPRGGVDRYCVSVRGRPCLNTSRQHQEVTGLTPGGNYDLGVVSVAGDGWSQPATISVFTRPRDVTEVTVSDVTNWSLVLSWTHTGNRTGFRVVAVEITNSSNVLFDSTLPHTQCSVTVSPLPPGTALCLTVRVLAQGAVDGHAVCVDGSTGGWRTPPPVAPEPQLQIEIHEPDPVPSLVLDPSANSIWASWDPPAGSYQSFLVSVQLLNSSEPPIARTTNATSLTEGGLFTAAAYQVAVTTLAGGLSSKPTVNTTHTLPVTPENLSVSRSNATHVTLRWDTPGAAETTEYLVTFHNSFWNHSGNHRAGGGGGGRGLTVGELRPGSFYVFGVSTLSDGKQSLPVEATHLTDRNTGEVTLSMVCSSAQPLICEEEATKEAVLTELKRQFTPLLDDIAWELRWKKR